MPLTWEQCKIATDNVYRFLDTIDLQPYLDKFKNKQVDDLEDELESLYPYEDAYSKSLFDFISTDEFCTYLDNRYGKYITREETITRYYIR